MSVRTVKSMRSLPSMRKTIHSSTSAPNPSHLLASHRDTGRSHLNSLTVQGLKQECRTRGLKLTGRKVELVDRIMGFEQAQTFSSMASKPLQPKAANGKSSKVAFKVPVQQSVKSFMTSATLASPESIDSYQVPPPQVRQSKDHPVSRIPVGPSSEGSSVELQSDGGLESDTGASAGDVHVVDGSSRVSTMNVDLGDGDPKHEDEHTGYSPSNHLPSKDKTFLWGLGGLVTLWWSSQWIGSKNHTTE